jgi:hypothetical protein
MGSDELYITKRCGKEQPFTLPPGYFESFSERLSNKLPYENHTAVHFSVWQRYRAVIAAAACVCVLGVCATTFFMTKSSKASVVANHSAMHESINEGSMDCVADYTMLDNEDIYALVSNY